MRAYLIIFILLAGTLPGCARFQLGPGQAYQTIKASPTRDTEMAKKKHARAMRFLDLGDIPAAEQMINEALLADRNYGPAHNTLGKIYFDKQQYYLAAWEFEYAQRMMPSRAEPLNNLGLVMEAVRQYDEAVTYYYRAVEIEEENSQYLGNLIRARIRRGDDVLALQSLLGDFILIDSRPSWVQWARSLLVDVDLELDARLKEKQASEEESKEEQALGKLEPNQFKIEDMPESVFDPDKKDKP